MGQYTPSVSFSAPGPFKLLRKSIFLLFMNYGNRIPFTSDSLEPPAATCGVQDADAQTSRCGTSRRNRLGTGSETVNGVGVPFCFE